MRQTEKDVSKLCEQIDMVYANFNYPEDMEKFITYMPMDAEYISTDHSIEENRCYLLSQLDNYISKQVEKYKLQYVQF